MNYTTLMAAVKSYLEVDETTFDTYFPTMVELTEEDIYRQVQLPDLRKNSTSLLVSGDQYLSTPSDFLSAYSLSVTSSSNQSYLISKEVDFIREAYPNASTTGLPRFYAVFDEDNFILAPTPDSNYAVELHYFYKPEPLSSTNTSTWLSDNAENALLYGCLYHGYIYLKGDQDVITQYKGQFDKAVADLKLIAEGRVRKDSYRTADKRMPV